MGRVKSNWLVRLLLFVGGIFSVRLISTVLHMTTLDKLYKPRDFRKTSHLEISQDIVDSLPRYCQTIYGRKMDPINLIFVGTDIGIKRAFEKAGWSGAHPSSPLHVLAGMASSVFNKSYLKGPFMPLFISVGLQDISFQKAEKGKYATRHHIRIWRTRHELPDGNRIWVGAASYETSFKLGFRPPFIHHFKQPNLDIERDYIADELTEQGHLGAGDHQLNPRIKSAEPARDPHGDPYFTDGKAKVIEIV